MTARPPWALLAALVVTVSAAVYGVARWQPFAPESPPVAAGGAGGDAVRGEAVFARSCASCHGTGGAGGGIGPRLVDAGLLEASVASIVATGRGVMPGGLVEGTDAADVSAYVAKIGGVGAAEGPAGGRARITGGRLDGLRVQLDLPAPANWTVWIDGLAGRLPVATIIAGTRGGETPSIQGGQTILGRYDRVLVGTDVTAPALAGSLSPSRSRDLLTLLVDDPAVPGRASLLDAAHAQVDVLREHVRFLVAARDEGNLANVRFHGEHLVNIARGEPARDIDGNGEASNPGDGVGLIDGGSAYLRRVGALTGPALTDPDRAVAAVVTRIASRGELSGRAESVAAARRSIAAIEAADARLDDAWSLLRERAAAAAVIELGP